MDEDTDLSHSPPDSPSHSPPDSPPDSPPGNSLLDKVLQNREKWNERKGEDVVDVADVVYVAEDGEEIYQSTIDAVNRFLAFNRKTQALCTVMDPITNTRQVCLATNRSQVVDLFDRRTFLSYLHGDWTPPTQYQAVLAVSLIKQYLPRLSKDYYQVSSNLFWDIRNQKLVTREELDYSRDNYEE